MTSFGNAASSHSGLIPLKTASKKEGNCSGRSRERRILLPRIQLLLLQFVYVIWSIPTNFALFQKPLNKFVYKLDNHIHLSINIPCKFQEHCKQGRLVNSASKGSNFFPQIWVYKWSSSLFIGIVFKFHLHVHN